MPRSSPKRRSRADPKLYEARELIARVALEDNNEEKAVAEANKAVAMSPEALDAMAILATVDWLNDKPSAPPAGEILTSSPWMDKILKINPHDGEALRYGRTLLRHQPPLYRRDSNITARHWRWSRNSKARAASWAST